MMKTREEHIKAIIDDTGLSGEDIGWIAGQLVAISLMRILGEKIGQAGEGKSFPKGH